MKRPGPYLPAGRAERTRAERGPEPCRRFHKSRGSAVSHRRMRTRTIRQSVTLPGPPEEVYRALMSTKGHEGFTGAPARISPRVGGSFVAWGGYIHGKNLELVPGRRIVQAWRPSEDSWPPRYFSKVTFLLAKTKGGTRLRFVHSGVPVDHADHLSEGWKESYWQPLAKYFRGRAESGQGRRPKAARKRR